MNRQAETRVAVLRHDRDGLICCRVCGCTDRKPCHPPCSWAEGQADLCSTCEDISLLILVWSIGAHRANWAALQSEVKRMKEDLACLG